MTPASRFSRSASKVFARFVMAALAVAAPCAAAQTAVASRTLVQADGTRMLEQSVEVPAAVAAVWDAWTTTAGFRSWAAPVAQVELRVGGIIEASYDFDAAIGNRDNIRNEIVAFVPARMLAIRNVQAPRKVPFDAATFQALQTVVFLEPAGANATRVTIVMPGIGSGPAHEGVHKHFAWGNAYTLDALRNRFVDGPTDWAKVKAANQARATKP